MTPAPAQLPPNAILCIDCGRISEAPQNCPVCGSRAVLNLGRLLDREEAEND